MTNKIIKNHIAEHLNLVEALDDNFSFDLFSISEIIIEALRNNHTIFWCGNGGSASDAQHLSAELIGRFIEDRKPLKSIPLTGDSTSLSCISNDYGFLHIFSRPLESLGEEGDVLICISTSGNSQNVINACEVAKRKKIVSIGFLGRDGGKMKNLVDHKIIIPSESTARIQEIHILLGHIICDLIEIGLGLKK